MVLGLSLGGSVTTQEAQLTAPGAREPTRLFGIIWLDAADIGRLLRLQDLHELQEAHLELCGNLVSQGGVGRLGLGGGHSRLHTPPLFFPSLLPHDRKGHTSP